MILSNYYWYVDIFFKTLTFYRHILTFYGLNALIIYFCIFIMFHTIKLKKERNNEKRRNERSPLHGNIA